MSETPEGGALAAPPRPQRGDELELEVDSLAFGGEGVARLGDGGYVVFVAGADSRRPRARGRAQAQALLRPRAHARGARAEPRADRRRGPQHPGVPWQVLPYERQLEVKREQVDEALRRIGGLDGFELEPIVPARRSSGATATSSSTRSASGPAGELVCGFHDSAGARSVSRSRTACSPPSAATARASWCSGGAASRA